MDYQALNVSKPWRSELFPFTIYAYKNNHTPALYDVFHKNKIDGKLWYAYDVVIKDKTTVDFIVRDMADMVYGGIGNEIYRIENVKVAAEETLPIRKREALCIAKVMREKELLDQENAIIEMYAEKIMKGKMQI